MKAKWYEARKCWRFIIPARLNEGKKQARYFKTKELAEAEIARVNRRGTARAPQIDDHKLAVLTIAEKRGLTPDDVLKAIDYYQRTVLSITKHASLHDLIARYLERQAHEKRAVRTLGDDRSRFGMFGAALGDMDVALLTENMLREYLASYKPGSDRLSHYKAVHKLTAWAYREGYLANDPMDRIEPMDQWGINNETIDMEDFRRLLFVTAGLEPIHPSEQPTARYLLLLPYYVLGGLAGLRRREMLRDSNSQEVVQWTDIDWSKNLIAIRDKVAKQTKAKDKRRWIPLEPAAREWLQMVRQNSGPVVDIWASTHTGLSKELLTRLKIKLPKNGLRNSYASYAQSFRSLSEVAKACGDLESTIKRNYTEPMAPDEGRAWFDIRPSTPSKIIHLSA